VAEVLLRSPLFTESKAWTGRKRAHAVAVLDILYTTGTSATFISSCADECAVHERGGRERKTRIHTHTKKKRNYTLQSYKRSGGGADGRRAEVVQRELRRQDSAALQVLIDAKLDEDTDPATRAAATAILAHLVDDPAAGTV
jgi:hypothetical protein